MEPRWLNLPSEWPKTRPLGVSVSVMLEGWTDDAAPGIGPMGNPLRPGVFDTQAKSWAEYGARTGAWRLLEVLELAERHPELMQAIAKAGHPIAAHSWSQHIIPAYQTREEEHADLKRCMRALEISSGTRPQGWISPRATPSLNTPELLALEGFTWLADAFDRDLPYRLETKSGPLSAIPFTMEVNDFPLCIRYGHSPETFVRTLQAILDGWPDIRSPFACIDLTAHAHVFGRPAGAIAFKQAIRLAQANAATWMTTHAELSRMFGR
jgi:peptidoglycan/xylan/chitin deacetylase (PgdA/CDA1 family)